MPKVNSYPIADNIRPAADMASPRNAAAIARLGLPAHGALPPASKVSGEGARSEPHIPSIHVTQEQDLATLAGMSRDQLRAELLQVDAILSRLNPGNEPNLHIVQSGRDKLLQHVRRLELVQRAHDEAIRK